MLNINLIPPTIKLRIKQVKQAVGTLRVSATLIIFFILINIGSSLFNVYDLTPKLVSVKNQLAQANANLIQFEPFKKQAIEINERVKIASQIDVKRVKWSETIQNLNNLTPQTVQLATLKTMTNKSPNLALTATTDNEINIVLMQDKLSKSDFFKNVSLKNAAATNNIIPFSLEFDLKSQSFNVTKSSTK